MCKCKKCFDDAFAIYRYNNTSNKPPHDSQVWVRPLRVSYDNIYYYFIMHNIRVNRNAATVTGTSDSLVATHVHTKVFISLLLTTIMFSTVTILHC